MAYELSGELVLVIHATTWGQLKQRRNWIDAKIQRVEALIPEFVAGLMRMAVFPQRQEEARKQREDEKRRAQEADQPCQEIQEEGKARAF